jgi:tetratricopeptide (TPR) repeat protein/NAD-dependent SIR2 family protein deacetylase
MSTERNIEDVVETLKKAHDRKTGCVLLIGAGCSKTAGIPLASEFVEIIKKEYPQAYKHAVPPTYPNCMEKLSVNDRKTLIARHVDVAKINWSHIAIAQLIKHGYVDRVLTTNFDPLVIRACALVGEFPAVYDSASSMLTEGADVHEKSVFYLHGQRTGFMIMNTQAEVDGQKHNLAPVFDEAGVNRMWLVVGYSGENDPVFEHLAQINRFKNHLYWVGYRDNDPQSHVKSKLLEKRGVDAYYVRGHDSDNFFIKLAQALDCFPPVFFKEPCSYLRELKSSVCEFPLPDDGKGTVPITSELDRIIALSAPKEQGGKKNKSTRQSILNKAQALFAAGKHDEIIALYNKATPQVASVISNLVAWSYIAQGNTHYNRAQLKGNEAKADKLFELAGQKYAEAVCIKPDMHDAFFNWGGALDEQARLKGNEAKADKLFELAGQKYAEAVRIKPDKVDAFCNWGIALADQARLKGNEAKADKLFELAGQKYAEAVRIKPDDHQAYSNWGVIFSYKAQLKGNEVLADKLFELAGQKYAKALCIKPDDYGTHFNLACLEGLKGNPINCCQHLVLWKKYHPSPTKMQLDDDKDFDRVRGSQEFQQFRNALTD